MKKKLPKVIVKEDYTKLKGGLDLQSPALSIPPGALTGAMNYVCNTDGGYERIDGYERYDGRPSPSDATYYYCPCSFTDGGPVVGDTITGDDSGQTAIVIVVGDDYICITKSSGAFNDDEVFSVLGNPKGTFSEAQIQEGQTSAYLNAVSKNLAADVYRNDIAGPSYTRSGDVEWYALLFYRQHCRHRRPDLQGDKRRVGDCHSW